MAGEGVIRKVLSAIPWRKLTYAQARELALRGEHLVEREGQFVGAPRGVGRAQLPRMRALLDEAASRGASGADWYNQARAANTEMSGGNPQMARELAAGQAVYSNQATPSDALGRTLAQRNRSLLEGPEAAAKGNYRYGLQAKQYGDVLQGGDPEKALGLKTGPYFRHMDPTDAAAENVGVNDSWMGDLYGYKRKTNVAGRGGGFSKSEHSFMHGESVHAAERARLAGVIPEGEGAGPWQAAAWVGQRARMLREKFPDMPEAELMERAKASVPDAMEKFTAYETTEQVPPRANEHLAGAVDLPMEKRDELTRALRAAAPGEADPYYRALGMAQRPSTEGLGQFTEAVKDEGPLRFQPAFRRPDTGEVQAVVGFHDMTQLPETWAEALDRPGKPFDTGFVDQHGRYYTREEAAAAIRGAERTQRAAEAVSRRPMSNRAGDTLPYTGSKERYAWEDQYRKNVEEMRGAPGRIFQEADIPLSEVEGSHTVNEADPRTAFYARGFAEGAPPHRLLVYQDPQTGRYFILDGNRVFAAAQRAKLEKVPALIERETKPKGKFPPGYNPAAAAYEEGGAGPTSYRLDSAQLTSERLTSTEKHFGQPQTRTDYNPNQTMRPMVSYQGGAAARRAPQLDQPSAEMLKGVNTLRSAVDAQAAGAYHTVKFTSVPEHQNAARIAFPEPPERELTSLLYERASADGLSLIDTGGGSFTLTGDFGQMPAGKFKKAAGPLLAELEHQGARVRLGKYIGEYNELPAYGEGRVTEKVLADVTPRVGKKLNTAELRAHYLAKNEAEPALAEKMGLGAPREDVQKLRRLLAKGGVEGLRKYVKGKDIAKLGLPGVAAGVYVGQEDR